MKMVAIVFIYIIIMEHRIHIKDTGGHGGSPINKKDVNHAWNMVYVDERWMFLDSTWDSHNRYENGQFIKNPPNHNYMWFDTSIEVIALSHYIVDDMYLSPVYELFESGEDEQDVDITYGTVKVPLRKIELPEGYELVYTLDEDYNNTAYILKGNLVVKGNHTTDEIVVYYTINKFGKEANFEYYTFFNIIDECQMKSKNLSKEILLKGEKYDFSDMMIDELGPKVKYKVAYTTTNKKIATINKKGIVTAKSKGKVTVKAVFKVGTQTFTYKQNITVK